MKRPPSLKSLTIKVNEWNSRVKNGDVIIYDKYALTPTLKGTELFEGKQYHEATILGNHTAVVWIEGVSGCVSMDFCTPKSHQPEGGDQ